MPRLAVAGNKMAYAQLGGNGSVAHSRSGGERT
jgi:hypothetical protein